MKPEIPSDVLNNLWEELLLKHESCWAKVVSDSMYPVVRRGDLVLVERVRPDKIRFGDIVVFKQNRKLITHRVIGKRKIRAEFHFLEKGDASLQSSLVPAIDLLGRISVIRTADKTIPTLSGSGRLLQLTLASISCTSLQMWKMLQHLRSWQCHASNSRDHGAVYGRFVSLLHRFVLRLFLVRLPPISG